ncbi:MAG TPA: zinc-binding dehydrogenase [Candidatus Synoicihabitans sp.]|nr:zinc-binding dehydrogenase [Candidatus Synoicihabitans sp.]
MILVSASVTTRAARITGPGKFVMEETPSAEPGPGQVRIRLEGCGVCGSNQPVWEGRPWFTYPLEPGAPGHEGWGRIEAVGDGVTDWQIGDRVAALSYHAFADADIAEASNVVRLPEALEGQPFPGEALGCALNVFARAGVEAHHTVAVVGVGFLGALLVNLAAATGARTIAISRRKFSREIARRMGATDTLPWHDEINVTLSAVRELTHGAMCERVIEATGLQRPLDLAGELVAERGRLVIAGFHQDGPRQINLQSWNWRGIDVINAHERDPRRYVEGMQAAVDAVASGQLDPTLLYTHRFRLEETGAALDCLRDRPADFLKALVWCE